MIKVNLGSGYKRFSGFVNVDGDPLVKPDYLVDLEKESLPFDDNSVEEIKAHHILEHIGDNFFNLMKEMYRVCAPRAIIDIEVPHHRHDNFYGDPTHVRFITIDLLKQFSKKYNQWHIKTYNSSSGFGLRLNVDFEILDFDYTIDSDYFELANNKEFSKIAMMAKQFNNVYKDLRVKMLVIKDD